MTRGSSADVLLHPVRLRIVQSLLGDAELTTAEIAERMPDVPTATLYRHVARLMEAGVLHVVGERQARGSVERTYGLVPGAGEVVLADLAAMDVEQHRRAFAVFVASLLRDYDRYLDAGDADLVRDKVGYRQAAMHLTDREMDALIADLRTVLEPRLARKPRRGTRRRVLTTIVMPQPGP